MTAPVPVGQLLAEAAAILAEAGIEAPAREARLLLLHALGRPATALLDRTEPVLAPALPPLLARRAAREPMALILGRQGFWTLDLEVSPATLIPRADSEAIVEAALAAAPAPRRVLDLGTGTGCLLLAVLSERKQAWGLGIDLSPDAATLAARNARTAGLAARAAVLAADWSAPLSQAARFDLVLSNPPYIPTQDLSGLMPEVLAHEPPRALDGGPDGLAAYRHIIATLPALLAPGGVAVLEVGIGQAAPVAALALAQGLAHIATRPDLAGIPRAVVLAGGDPMA
jgi:release factor glutamine methyltransferase